MTAPTFWTLDLGNSALKLRERASLGQAEASLVTLANDSQLAGELRCRLDRSQLAGIAFSSVASTSVTAELEPLLRGASPVFVATTDSLLANESTVPETVGKDRLFAALGAMVALPVEEEAVIVCDAGTALTVDLVLRNEQPDSVLARFVGGAIAPGPELLASALAAGGARLFDVGELIAGAESVRALGHDTAGALSSGVVHGFRGAARELVMRIAEEAGLQNPPIRMTGGARGLLAGLFDEERVVEDAALVDRGLLAALAREFEG